jgi:hypothetical protein
MWAPYGAHIGTQFNHIFHTLRSSHMPHNFEVAFQMYIASLTTTRLEGTYTIWIFNHIKSKPLITYAPLSYICPTSTYPISLQI